MHNYRLGDIVIYTVEESQRHLNNDMEEATAIITNILDNGRLNLKIITDASAKDFYRTNVPSSDVRRQ